MNVARVIGIDHDNMFAQEQAGRGMLMSMGRRTLPTLYIVAIFGTPAIAVAQPGQARTGTTGYAFDEGAEEEQYLPARPPPDRDDEPRYRNPQGSINLSAVLGAASSDSGTRFVFGGGIGYAFLTGVMPGVRGLIATGNGGTGGELAATLTLTPPLSFSFTPFVAGEVGRRFEPFGAGWIYGAGGGIYFGDPGGSVAVQLGWMFRRIDFGAPIGSADISGPIVGVSISF